MKFRILVMMMAVAGVSISCSKDKGDDDSGGTNEVDPAADGAVDGTDAGEDGGTDAGDDGAPPASENVVVSGQLAISTDGPAPDTAIAFPVEGGVMDKTSISGTTPAPVTDGALALSIPSEGGYGLVDGDEGGGSQKLGGHVIVVFKDSEDRFEKGRSLRFLNVNTGADTSAVNILTSKLKEKKLDLGTISGSGSDLTGSTEVGAEDFDLNIAVVQELATTDRAIKSIKNTYMNTVVDPESGKVTQFIESEPGFMWSGDATKLIGASLEAPAAVDYTGYLMFFKGVHPALSTENLCGATTGKLELVPPKPLGTGEDAIQVLNNDNTEAAAKANADTENLSCGTAGSGTGTSFYVSAEPSHTVSGKTAVNFNWGGGSGLSGSIPAGEWQMKYDGEVIGVFDLAAGNPMDSQSGKPYIYVPAVKVTTDPTTKVVQKVEIKLFLWNKATGKWKVVEDLTAFRSLVEHIDVGFYDYSRGSGPRAEQGVNVPLPESGGVITVSKDTKSDFNEWTYAWRLGADFTNGQADEPDDGDKPQPTVESISIGYKMYGTSYRFDFRLPQ